jgi:hypothetical protein
MKKITFLLSLFLIFSNLYSQQKFIGNKYLLASKDETKIKENIKKYRTAEFKISQLKNFIKNKHKIYDGVIFNLEIEGENVEFRLFENDIFDINFNLSLNNQIVNSEKTDISTFAGYANNNPENVIRLYVSNEIIRGYYTTAAGKYIIEPIDTYRDEKDKKQDYDKVIVYRQDDEISNNGEMICGNFLEKQTLQNIYKGNKGAKVAVDNGCKVLRIAVETDNQFSAVYNNNTALMNANIADWFNRAEEVYVRHFKLRLKITSINYHTSSDPFGDAQNTLSYVFDQYRNYWKATKSTVPRDLAYFLTGKGVTYGDPNTSSYGYADISSVCVPDPNGKPNAFAFSTIRQNIGQTILSTENIYRNICHEIGHTVGAADVTACTIACNIMYPQLGKSNNYDGSSVTAISNYLGASSCLSTSTSQNYASLFTLKLDGANFTPVSPFKLITNAPHTVAINVTNNNTYALHTDFIFNNPSVSVYNKTNQGTSFHPLGTSAFGLNIYSYIGPSNIAANACFYDSWTMAFKLTSNARLNAFPNPSADYIEVEKNTDIDSKDLQYKIYTESGTLVKESTLLKANFIQTRDFKNGIYFLHIMNGNEKVEIKRIVIKH